MLEAETFDALKYNDFSPLVSSDKEFSTFIMEYWNGPTFGLKFNSFYNLDVIHHVKSLSLFPMLSTVKHILFPYTKLRRTRNRNTKKKNKIIKLTQVGESKGTKKREVGGESRKSDTYIDKYNLHCSAKQIDN